MFSLQSKLSQGVLEQGPAQDGASSLAGLSGMWNLSHFTHTCTALQGREIGTCCLQGRWPLPWDRSPVSLIEIKISIQVAPLGCMVWKHPKGSYMNTGSHLNETYRDLPLNIDHLPCKFHQDWTKHSGRCPWGISSRHHLAHLLMHALLHGGWW